MHFRYETENTCSKVIEFDINDIDEITSQFDIINIEKVE